MKTIHGAYTSAHIFTTNNPQTSIDPYAVKKYKSEMKGIYSSCIGRRTLDEAPFAYRRLDEIQDTISETVSIDKIIRPIYNFKANEH